LYAPDTADHLVDQDALHVQFVSTDQLTAQTIAAQAIELMVQGFEGRASNNQFVTLKIFVCDATGTIKETLLAITRDGVEISSSTVTSRSLTATTTAATVEEGDRLVFEIGTGGLPTDVAGTPDGHNTYLRWGENGAGGDLLTANDTQTGTTLNPWLEFANVLTFQPSTTPKAIAATAVGVAGLTRLSTFSRSLAAVNVGIVSMPKRMFVTLSSVSVGAAGLAQALRSVVTMPATAVGTAGLSMVSTFFKTLAAASVGVVSLTRANTFFKTLAAASVGVVSLTRANTFFKTLAATSVGATALVAASIIRQAMSATMSGLASLVPTFIAGGGEETYKKVACILFLLSMVSLIALLLVVLP